MLDLEVIDTPLDSLVYVNQTMYQRAIINKQDTVVSWASLEFQPEFTATASNIGYGQWSHDIGGHMNGIKVGLPCFTDLYRC